MEFVEIVKSLAENLAAPMLGMGIIGFMLYREQTLHAADNTRFAGVIASNTAAMQSINQALTQVAEILRTVRGDGI